MMEEEEEEEEERASAYVRAYTLALGALPSMFTRAACELGIPDILHTHQGQPLSALHLASHLPFPPHLRPPPPSLHRTAAYLDRIMRFLCSHGLFNAHLQDPSSSSSSSSLPTFTYTLTPLSKWLLNPRATNHPYPPGSGVACPCSEASSSVDAWRTGTPSSSQLMQDQDHPSPAGDSVALDDIPTTDRKHVLRDTCACDAAMKSDIVQNSWDKSMSLHDFMLFQTCEVLQPPLQHLAQFILEGGEEPFYKAHGIDGWSFLNSHSEFSHLFNAGMSCDADISVALLLQNYHDFNDVHTLVDVGGGIGTIASRIVAHHPSIKALNFDLPYVVTTAPTYPGVEHIGGDMFQDIPRGDAIFLRSTLHTWDDKSCIKILKNCHKALPKHGKLIIMDVVLSNDFGNKSPLYNLQVALDVLMMVNTQGGKERTKQEWEIILKAAEFQIKKVVELPCPQCIIEAFPISTT